MKTLDEVIDALEICFSDNSRSDCTGCPYADEDGDAACFNHDREDALHYLKAFRDDKDDLTALRAFWAEQQANPALTWDELRQMEGKPVWMEYDGWKIIESFETLEDVHQEIINFTDGKINCRSTLERGDWQAYRKERNENVG